MVTIVFESHATTFDNEQHLASGHNDVDLSPVGISQAKELGQRYQNDQFGAIFCSDLQRSYKTAAIAFKDKFTIIQDARLRECDYGELTQHPEEEVKALKVAHLNHPFPQGESYEQTSKRMKGFLTDLLKNYADQRVMVIGHRATQYGLEHWILGKTLHECVTDKWNWQPGWKYNLQKIVISENTEKQ